MKLPDGSEAALPHGVVSAEQVVEILRDADYDGYALGVESSVDYVEARDSQWRKALDEAQARIEELEWERDLALRSSDEYRLALAASQAECAELREALRWVQLHGSNREESIIVVTDTLSRPTGTQDALREVCKRVAHAAKGPRPTRIASDGGEYYLTDEEWDVQTFSRVLWEVAK